jgi:hypothetical protein
MLGVFDQAQADVLLLCAFDMSNDKPTTPDDDPSDTPDTPPTEPKPVPIEEPPPPPERKGPFIAAADFGDA